MNILGKIISGYVNRVLRYKYFVVGVNIIFTYETPSKIYFCMVNIFGVSKRNTRDIK